MNAARAGAISGVHRADGDVVILQPQRHVVGAGAGQLVHALGAQGLEVDVPEPGHVASVRVVVVDRDHGGVAAGGERLQAQPETAGVLDQDKVQGQAVDDEAFAAAEGRRHLGQRGEQGGVVRGGSAAAADAAGQGQRRSRVEDVVDAAELHRGGDRGAVVLKIGVVRPHPAEDDVGGRLLRYRRRGGAAGAGAQFVVVGEGAQQRVVEAEVAGRPARSSVSGDAGHPRILTVEDHGSGGLGGDVLQELGGLVDLAEAVQLVTQDVEQEAVARRNTVDEVHGVGFVELQHGDVGVEPCRASRLRPAGRRPRRG